MTYYGVMKKKKTPLADDVQIVPISGNPLTQGQTNRIEVACTALRRGDYVAIAELIARIEELRTDRR